MNSPVAAAGEAAPAAAAPASSPKAESPPAAQRASEEEATEAALPLWRDAAVVAAADAAGLLWAHVRGFPMWPAQAVAGSAVERLALQHPRRGAPTADVLVRCQLPRACSAPAPRIARRRRGLRGGARFCARADIFRAASALSAPVQLVQFFGTSEYAWLARNDTLGWAAGLAAGAWRRRSRQNRAALVFVRVCAPERGCACASHTPRGRCAPAARTR